MTIKETLSRQLQQHGLWPEEAEAVLSAMAEEDEDGAMEGRWDDSFDGYPPQFASIMLASAKNRAIDWIDANKPKHFARAILAG